MARKPVSRFNEITTSLRRIVVLSVAALGLVREWPIESIGIRVIAVWAVLYLASMTIELVFQYLSHSALSAEHLRGNPTAGEREGV